MAQSSALEGSLDVLESLVNGTKNRRSVLEEEMRRAEGAKAAYNGLVKFVRAQVGAGSDVGENSADILKRIVAHAEGAELQLVRHYDSMVGRLEECKWREESLKEMASDVKERIQSGGKVQTKGAPPPASETLKAMRKRKGELNDNLPPKR